MMQRFDDFREGLPTLTSQRLRLRALRPQDAADLFAVLSDPLVTEYYELQTLDNIAEAAQLLGLFAAAAERLESFRWAITLLENDQLIGTCALLNINTRHARCELSYDLASQYWRQGYMSEVLELLLPLAFSRLRLQRIQATVPVGNAGSLRLLRKFGFQTEGLLREYLRADGRWVDATVLSVLAHELKL
jgi:ribosomal-protein-alanine N-acetyltransferase